MNEVIFINDSQPAHNQVLTTLTCFRNNFLQTKKFVLEMCVSNLEKYSDNSYVRFTQIVLSSKF